MRCPVASVRPPDPDAVPQHRAGYTVKRASHPEGPPLVERPPHRSPKFPTCSVVRPEVPTAGAPRPIGHADRQMPHTSALRLHTRHKVADDGHRRHKPIFPLLTTCGQGVDDETWILSAARRRPLVCEEATAPGELARWLPRGPQPATAAACDSECVP